MKRPVYILSERQYHMLKEAASELAGGLEVPASALVAARRALALLDAIQEDRDQVPA